MLDSCWFDVSGDDDDRQAGQSAHSRHARRLARPIGLFERDAMAVIDR
jgi:hypothetical protein